MKLEKDIQKDIIHYLKLRNIPISVTDASRAWGRDGGIRKSKVSPDHPDLSCVLPVYSNHIKVGLAFFIEVKSSKGKLRDGQKYKLIELSDTGAVCLVARSVEEVEQMVERFMSKELKQEDLDYANSLLLKEMSSKRKKKTTTALPF